MTTQKDQTKLWLPWFRFIEHEEEGKRTLKAQCLFCNKSKTYRRDRCLEHYGYTPVANKELRAVCEMMPMTVRDRFQHCSNVIPGRMSHVEMYGTLAESSGATQPVQTAPTTHSGDTNGSGGFQEGEGGPVQEPLQSSQERSRADSYNPRPMRQQQFSEAYQLTKRKELDEKWAAFFYEANVAFNVARHPAFVAAVKATSTAGFNYTPPSYHAMRTKHIEPKVKQVKAEIEKATKQSITLYGSTICSDGWDNVVHRPLMNVMLVCPAGDIFIGSVDTTGNKKTKEYIARELRTYIEAIGPSNVTQICSDNASAMLGALDDVVRTYPHLYKQGCCAHILDLLLEDWGKEELFKALIIRAKKVCNFIRNHHAPLALYRQYSPRLSLKVPPETRFACNFLMISRMLEVKDALERMVIDPRWAQYAATLFNRQNGVRAHALVGEVRTTIRDDGFWQQCENFEDMVEPVIKTLRVFDGRTPAMAKAWLEMNNLKRHVFSLREPDFNLPGPMATRLENQFMQRWDMMITDLHYAGALLNPFLMNVLEIQNNGHAKRALNRVVQKLSGPLGVDFNEVMNELTQYEEQQGPYGPLEAPNIREINLLPHQWWHRVGGNALPIIAKRILSLTCSASSCERNWSMYSFVHSKTRNRLGVEKAEALVYIYTNTRLLRQRPGADPVRYYDDNIFSEDSDDDAGALSETDDDDYDGNDDNHGNGGEGHDGDDYNNGDGGEGHDGNDGDSSDDGDQYRRAEPPVFAQQPRPDDVFNWNGIDEEIANGVGGHAAVGPIGNVHVNEEEPERSEELAHERADEEPDDVDYDEGANEPGREDGNAHGRNGDDNDHDEGGGIGAAIHGNNEAASVGSADGGSSNVPREQQTEEAPNQGVHIENIPPPSNTTVNPQVPVVAIPTVINTIDVDIHSVSHIVTNAPQERVASIGRTLVGLGRPSSGTSARPPRPPGSTMDHSISGSSMNRDTGVGPMHGSGSRTTGQNSREGSRGRKRPFEATTVRTFYTGPTLGSSSGPATCRGPDVDEDANNSSGRRVKRLVQTRVGNNMHIGLRNVNSDVEAEVVTNNGDESLVLGDDEMTDGAGTDREEAPSDGDVVMRGVTPSNVRTSRINLRSRVPRRRGRD